MMTPHWEKKLERWVSAGVVDGAAAERIRAFEAGESDKQGLRWPVLLALAFGGLMLGAGVLLFVAAHWENLSPSSRFSLVLLLVAVFHLAGASLTEKFPALSMVMHAMGTVALGAGIFLAGQIFNLEEHWPGGLMLWAAGAWMGYGLRRDGPQALLAALLTPAWLGGEWAVATERYAGGDTIVAQGMLLLAITYLTARDGQHDSNERRALAWIGGLSLVPFVIWVLEARIFYYYARESAPPLALQILGWATGFALPLALAMWLRGRASRWNFVSALWVVVLGTISTHSQVWYMAREYFDWPELLQYVWCALGSVGLVAWGLHEKRKERINLGMAGFAITVLAFYFSSVMDKLGRSTSLISLGLLFLLGGWFLEKTRRRLVARLEQKT